MPAELPTNGNTYIIDPESGAEMARLMNQDRLITRGMGGIFPERDDISTMHDILDIACGPGGWVLEMAYQYPKIQIVGIDISRTMIEYARAQARSQGLENATFQVMDALKPLDFLDSAFDLVNTRYIATFMPKTAWPKLIQECTRLTRPGGTIRLTEAEVPITTSPAFEQMGSMLTRALQRTGQSFSPDGRQIAITPVLGRFLREAGCQNIRQRASAIDFSVGTDVHRAFYENFTVALQLLKPLFLKLGIATEEEFDRVYQQLLMEALADDFSAIWHYLTVWGENPKH